MLILLHVMAALAGLGSAGFSAIKPSKLSFRFTYGLVGLTFASGTYLVISAHANLVQTCISGLTYLGFIFIAMAIAHRRLSAESVKSK